MTSPAGIVAIIPARIASTRFPGKPLVDILGIPMVEHVRRRVALCEAVDDVYVATCDEAIATVVRGFGGKVIMTSADHQRGTDRVEEAVRGLTVEIVVNAQGDEPLVMPDAIEAAVRPLVDDERLACTNLVSPLQRTEDLWDPAYVKAFVNGKGFIMAFARWVKPHTRPTVGYPVFRQTGIYALRKTFLHHFAALPPTALEAVESIDMWRVLEHDYRIYAAMYPHATFGVDHPGDVATIEAQLREDPVQRRMHERIMGQPGAGE